MGPWTAASSENGSADLTGVNVLLVGDEASAREGTRALLEASGACVQAVESASGAKDAYDIQRPGILLSDIGLPGEDGYALMQELRSLERERGEPRMPAIALTAFARKEDRERALNAGYDVHVTKPVDPDRLVAEIARLVRRGE